MADAPWLANYLELPLKPDVAQACEKLLAEMHVPCAVWLRYAPSTSLKTKLSGFEVIANAIIAKRSAMDGDTDLEPPLKKPSKAIRTIPDAERGPGCVCGRPQQT
jgi:hypothetical protein